MSSVDSSSSTHHEESIITLQVGEREFMTTKTTLINESRHFRTLLSDPEFTSLQQEDGSYFIDKDPEVFVHTLRYLRTRVLPVFYDAKKGYDEVLYLDLLGQAKYFEIERLEDWITERKYRNVMKIQCTASLLEGTHWLDKPDLDSDADGEVQYFPAWSREMVYLCPRSIFVHRGKPEACGRDCHKAQGDKPDRFEEKVVFTTLRVRKEMLFERQICLPEQ